MDNITITGVVEEIIYYNDENGYTVFVLNVEDKDFITVTGYTANINEGESIQATGNWVMHSEYGQQFKLEYYKTVLPTKSNDILRYLSSGIVYGVRAATAKKLVQAFGEETLNVMLNDPLRMSSIKGISEKKAFKIHESFSEIQSLQNIVMFLQKYNISANLAIKVHKMYGADSVDYVKKNPYILSDNIDGIKFAVADKIAYGEGFAKNSPLRITSGLKYILNQAAYSSGHMYLPHDLLVEHGAYVLGIAENEIESVLSELAISKDVYIDTIDGCKVYYLYGMHVAESYIASRLKSMSVSNYDLLLTETDVEEKIHSYEKITGIEFAKDQMLAAITALGSNGCMILTGGPGTGKTTTINTIIKLFKDYNQKVVLAAPTGRAAKRMTQVTGVEAKTIHRLLGAAGEDGSGKFTFDETNPLDCDVVIVDEVSMIDVTLMYAMLKALRPGTRLILSGDADQLPSVGPGNVLKDIINSQIIPVIKLDKIFRQAEESLIVVNAHNINRGILPDISAKDKDFFFLRRNKAEDTAGTIVDLCANRLPIRYGIDGILDIQVISPSKKGICGSVNLNRMLQECLNPFDISKIEYSYGKTTFRVGDKVMQTKNNYELYYTREIGDSGVGIFNGDMGKIIDISVIDKYMVIMFDEDKRCEYPFTQLDELDLAYAITVHKSQGSEFPYVVMPATQFPPMLMCRNLFYTAVTRAKNMVVLVGSENVVEHMTMNNSQHNRYTGLCNRLIKSNDTTDLILNAIDERI